jgi:CRP-like cAMP-binding protein
MYYGQTRFAAGFQTAVFQPGDYIVKQGDVGDKFFMIEAGEVCVIDESAGASMGKVLCVLSDGHHFGEYWWVALQQRKVLLP